MALVVGSGGLAALGAQDGPPREATARANACQYGPVSRVDIRNNSLFAPKDIEGHRFDWALGLANWVHIRTRADFLRKEMLVKEAGCFDPQAVDESVRLIRDLDFIARVEVQRRLLPDSTWSLRVETWDEWTTQLGLDFDIENAFQFKGFFVTEKNLMGRGNRLSFRYRNFRERDDRSLTFSTGRFLGTRTNASVAAGTTRTGGFFRQDLSYPFVSESGRFSLLSHVQFEDREQSYLTGDHSGISHLLLPLADLEGYARLGRRYGVPGALTVVGGEVEWLHRTVSGPARQVVQGDFEGATTAPDSLAALLAPQDDPDSFLRVGATVGLRRLRFATARGLDRVSGTQNVAIGSELLFTAGRALETWGTSAGYTYGRVDGFVSGMGGPFLANTQFRAEGRVLDSATEGMSPWRDLSLRGRGLLYIQPGVTATNTFVAGLRFNLRGNVDQPYQTALGGEEGVRSYREDEVPTSTTLVAFAEHRINLPWLHPVVDIGLTFFGDIGRGWADDVPFGIDTGWRKAIGGGIRVGFPAGSGSVTRIEFAWPVGGPDQGRGPVFRTYWSPALTSR